MNAFIKSSFWSDDRIELLPPVQKLALLWLITNQSRDIAGFVLKISQRRFTFETGIQYEDLQRACQALPESFQALPDGTFFCTHFLRHNYGRHGRISSGNKIIVAVLRHVEALTSDQQALFFKAYPELAKEENNTAAAALQNKPLASPCQGLREGQGRAGQDKLLSYLEIDHEELSKMVESLVAAYPRKTHYAETLRAAKNCLNRNAPEFKGYREAQAAILAGVANITAMVSKWHASEQTRYLKQPPAFYDGDHWRDDPEYWRSHNEKPTLEIINLGGRKPAKEISA